RLYVAGLREIAPVRPTFCSAWRRRRVVRVQFRTAAAGRRFSPERAASSWNSVAPLRGRRGKGGADQEGQAPLGVIGATLGYVPPSAPLSACPYPQQEVKGRRGVVATRRFSLAVAQSLQGGYHEQKPCSLSLPMTHTLKPAHSEQASVHGQPEGIGTPKLH